MRLGFYVSSVAGRPGYENVVSGHVQLPLETIRLLQVVGYDVELITTKISETATLPSRLPAATQVHQVSDGLIRQVASDAKAFTDGVATKSPGKPAHRFKLVDLFRQIREIRSICKKRDLAMLHFFGHNKTAYLAGALRLLKIVRVPVLVTMVGIEPVGRAGVALRGVDLILVSTEFGQNQLKRIGIEAKLIRHGPIRDIMAEYEGPRSEKPTRILFWRDPSKLNGADVCLTVFKRLAPEYPHINFDFAIRPYFDEVAGLDAAAAENNNIHIYRFPYEEGVSLGSLLADSICSVMPFLTTSIDPQLSLAETLAAGVPVVTTDIRSNGELVEDGKNGFLVAASSANGTIAALRRLLDDPKLAKSMGENAAEILYRNWNWDDYVAELVSAYSEILKP